MKLKNVHYEYRGNDTWRIYFKDYEEAVAFDADADPYENERTDGKKPRCSPIFSDYYFGIRWYVEAKLTGRFNILRHCVKDPTNDYFSNDIWTNLVKKIEGSDSDYIFDEIDLWYDATADKCFFKIRCMNGTWTELFVKNMITQANGYYDTDTVGQGGLCIRRSCCGIGFDPSTNKADKERIMFSVKDYCSGGKTDIIKVSAWTSTFIGTNKENEKEYSWSDFKHCMGLLHANGSDIWDIEWKYDAACPMTGTEIADELHLYLKPLAYSRLFEEEKKDKTVWLSTGTLWSNNDCLARVQALTPPPVPKWAKLDDDCKIGFRQKDMDEAQKENEEMTKKIYEKLEIEPIDFIKEANNKEDNNMKIYWDESQPRIENIRDIVRASYRYDRSVYYYRVYFERVVDAKNVIGGSYFQDKGKHCWYYMLIASTAELSEETKGSIKTLYLTYNENETRYYINWKAMYAPLKSSANFEMKMTAEVNDAQLAVWEAALGIGSQTKQKEEKNMGPKDTTFAEFCRKIYWGTITPVKPTKILIQGTATIIWWSDGTKTIVKCQKGDKMDPEKGIAMCVMKKFIGTNETHSNYLDFAKPAIKDYEAKQKAMAAARKRQAEKKRRAAKKEKENGEA